MPTSMIKITKIICTPHERLPDPHLIHLGSRISIWRAGDPPTLLPKDPWADYGQPIGPPGLNFGRHMRPMAELSVCRRGETRRLCRQSEGYAVSSTTTPEAADFEKRKRSCAWLYYWFCF